MTSPSRASPAPRAITTDLNDEDDTGYAWTFLCVTPGTTPVELTSQIAALLETLLAGPR